MTIIKVFRQDRLMNFVEDLTNHTASPSKKNRKINRALSTRVCPSTTLSPAREKMFLTLVIIVCFI